MISHPLASWITLLCTPAAVNVPPAHVNGRSSVQIIASSKRSIGSGESAISVLQILEQPNSSVTVTV